MKFVIRAGGIGTRLWPYSRHSKPKQFHAMAGQQTMLQDAVGRIGPIAAPADICVSTGVQMAGLVGEQSTLCVVAWQDLSANFCSYVHVLCISSSLTLYVAKLSCLF